MDLTFLLACFLVTFTSLSFAEDSIYLTVVYCPDVFSGKGAVVRVNATSGAYTIEHRFSLPSQILGCPMMEETNYVSDVRRTGLKKPFDGRNAHLSWGTEWGMLTVVNLDDGTISHNVKGKSADKFLFDGFTSFAISSDAHTYMGLTPHVTESGFCDDGCFRLGHQNIVSGIFTGISPIPFKAIMSGAHFYDEKKHVYYTQGSYPLTSAAACDHDETAQCLIAINSTTGNFLWSKSTPDFEVYKYQDPLIGEAVDGTVLAWVFGFQSVCGKDLNSFAFARVNLDNATATLISCISKKDVVHFNPNMGGFSHDSSRFSTGSGNPETGDMQLLVFDTESGGTILDSNLPGLPKALGVSSEAPFVDIWGFAYMP